MQGHRPHNRTFGDLLLNDWCSSFIVLSTELPIFQVVFENIGADEGITVYCPLKCTVLRTRVKKLHVSELDLGGERAGNRRVDLQGRRWDRCN